MRRNGIPVYSQTFFRRYPWGIILPPAVSTGDTMLRSPHPSSLGWSNSPPPPWESGNSLKKDNDILQTENNFSCLFCYYTFTYFLEFSKHDLDHQDLGKKRLGTCNSFEVASSKKKKKRPPSESIMMSREHLKGVCLDVWIGGQHCTATRAGIGGGHLTLHDWTFEAGEGEGCWWRVGEDQNW